MRDAIAEVLFHESRRKLLALFFTRPDESFYLRHIVRLTGGTYSAIRRELGLLHKAGLLECSRTGNQLFYSANRKSPVFPELESIMRKTSGLVDVLRLALSTLRRDIKYAFVFGSFARGEQNRASDVDLMVIGPLTLRKILPRLKSAQQNLSREINPLVFSEEEFRKRVRQQDHFVSSVLASGKLFVLGEEHEFGADVQVWTSREI